MQKLPTSYCLFCGKELPRKNRRYCNNLCQAQHRTLLVVQDFVSGESGANNAYGLTKKSIRKYLIDRAGAKCEKCGWAEINPTLGYSPLEVHHVDGDYRNDSDANLMVLCPNCHALTATYRNLNKSNGRSIRQ